MTKGDEQVIAKRKADRHIALGNLIVLVRQKPGDHLRTERGYCSPHVESAGYSECGGIAITQTLLCSLPAAVVAWEVSSFGDMGLFFVGWGSGMAATTGEGGQLTYHFLGAALGAFFGKNPPKKGKKVPKQFTHEIGKSVNS